MNILRRVLHLIGINLYKNLHIGADTYWAKQNLDGIAPQLITIGRGCILAPTAMILTHDASFFIHTGRYKIAPVTIGDRGLVGYGAIIMPGVTLGDDVIVGAGAVVTEDVPAGAIVGGVPARVIGSTRELIEREREHLIEPPYRFGQPIMPADVLKFQQRILQQVEVESGE